MKKYLEFFPNGFDETITEKIKPENWPWVGYSRNEGIAYAAIPEPVIGPSDNEIWYTSSDGNVVTPNATNGFGANIVSNTYENDKGILSFDNDVTSIGGWAFYNCSSLTSIAIPNSVTIISLDAFSSCSSLTSVTIGNSVTSIEGRAFHYCSNLNSITYEGTQAQWNSITKGADWNKKVPATYVQCTDGQVAL